MKVYSIWTAGDVFKNKLFATEDHAKKHLHLYLETFGHIDDIIKGLAGINCIEVTEE